MESTSKNDELQLCWESGLLDEIGLVYEKANNDPSIKEQLINLEITALSEAQAACNFGGLLAAQVGSVLPPEAFNSLPEIDKETSIVMLAGKGISHFDISHSTSEITVGFSEYINLNKACTIFKLINSLEKLDGALNVNNSSWTLKLLIPLDGKSGMIQWEMLITLLYPWLSIQETSSNIVALPAGRIMDAKASLQVNPKEKSKKDLSRIFLIIDAVLFLLLILGFVYGNSHVQAGLIFLFIIWTIRTAIYLYEKRKKNPQN